ncbi:MAG: hypothetical protein JO147_10400, partial [Actinobacteria bacterium]|nr:hypothetical protein [Actinomycetota bacterium]
CDEPTLLFEGFAADDNDVVASQLHRQTPRDVVDETLSGAGALEGAADYPTGKFGGALRCATLDVNRVTAPVCAWADANSIGVTVMRDGDSAADAATIILAFRNQAEH